MKEFDIRAIKQTARERLESTRPDYRKLVALHGAISLGTTFLVYLLNLLVNQLGNSASGLDGLGTTAMLMTAQSSMSMALNFLLPFWEIGILYTAMQVARRQETGFPMLTRGFSRFGVYLRYNILLILIMIAVAMICSNIVAIYPMIVMPSDEVNTALKSIDLNAMAEVVNPAEYFKLIPRTVLLYILPAALLFAAPFFGVMIHLMYRFRMSPYVILDEAPTRARMSMAASNQLTKGYKWAIFKLDVSFWWYYLLQAALAAVMLGGEILTLVGVTLPVSDTISAVVLYAVYSIASVALAYFAGGYVQTAYACAYEQLCANQQELAVIPEPSMEDFGSNDFL